MKLLIDMNLSPVWREYLLQYGHETVHWSAVGRTSAPDSEVLTWAATNGRVLLTQDLDFGALLAAGALTGPSVIQIRAHEVHPLALGPKVVEILQRYARELDSGALISLDELRPRVRILPFGRST